MFIAVICLRLVLLCHTSAEGFRSTVSSLPSLSQRWLPSTESLHRRIGPSSGVNYNPNGTAFLWLPQDTYSGMTFFEWVDPFHNHLTLEIVISSGFDFWSAADPTGYVSVHYCCHCGIDHVPWNYRGSVKQVSFLIWLKLPEECYFSFVNQSMALQKNLTYITSDGKVIMKADDFTTLPLGAYRNRSVNPLLLRVFPQMCLRSVRISSKKTYTTGLFILDINRAPWGCGERISCVPGLVTDCACQGCGPHFGPLDLVGLRLVCKEILVFF